MPNMSATFRKRCLMYQLHQLHQVAAGCITRAGTRTGEATTHKNVCARRMSAPTKALCEAYGHHACRATRPDVHDVVGLWTRSWVVMPWLENARSDSAVIPTHRPASPAVGPWGISCNLNRDFLFCDLWPSRSRLTRPPLPWYHDTLVTGRAGSAHTCASVPTLDSGGSAEHERQHPSAFRRRP